MIARTEYPVAPLSYLADVRPSGVDKHTHADEVPVRLCNYTDIYYRERITNDIDFMEASATPAEMDRFALAPGDVVMTKDSETADDIGIPALVVEGLDSVLLGYHNTLVRPTAKLEPRFLFWFLSSRVAAAYWETKARGVTRVGLRTEDVAALPVPVPPLDTQRRIADMLDAETARIDALIGKKRQASSAARRRFERRHWDLVTGTDIRQLRPMSSASWVPGLPAGWSAPALRYLISWKYGHPFRSDGFTEESAATPVVRIRDLVRNRVQTWTDEWPDPSSWIDDGEIVIGMDGDFNVVRWGGGQAALNQRVCAVESQHPGLSNDYLAEAIKYPLHYINETVHFTTVRHLSFADLLAQRIPLPPSEEQHHIAKEIGQERMTLLRLQDVTERSISLLQSRRQALITAAVTGEIEV